MSSVTQLRPAQGMAPPPGRAPARDDDFWCDAVGSGLSVMVELSTHLDIMSASIARLPQPAALTRPAVARYLASVKALAQHWRERFRPGLEGAADALASTGACIMHPTLRRNHAASTARARGALPPALARRMASAIALLQPLSAELSDALDQMARASHELDADSVRLTERLQADQVHALMLSQQASTLQSKLDDATMRQHAYWLLGPHAEQIRQEIAMHGSAREGVRRQLDHLRAEQIATEAEARYLQHLLPSLSTYLAALDRLGGALRATLGGSRALLGSWRQGDAAPDGAAPEGAAPGGGAPGDALLARLHDAAPHWEALAALASRLHRPAAGAGITTPGGCRT